ncbi:hypothetical protein [Streptomyces decoyicus]|uniref:hypothetical protein n=1 Tax=Streptomyces decoyicus TaxID=249567 RepID=UPI00365CB1A6
MNAAPTFSLELDLPARPLLSVATSTLEHGQAQYTVRGPHVKGRLVVVPANRYGRPLGAHDVTVYFGDGTGPVKPYTARPDEPIVNGVAIHGTSEVIDTRLPLRRQAHLLTSHAVVLVDGFGTRRLPDKAREVTEAVVAAVLRHWLQRPDQGELRAAAERAGAAAHMADERRAITYLENELRTVRADRAAARQRSYQLAGTIRRRQPDIRPPQPAPARLQLTTRDGDPLGELIAREHEINALPGCVTYEISGSRIRTGLVTLVPDTLHASAPRSLYACWGRPTNSSWFPHERTDMPAINRVTMSGGWFYSGNGDVRTAQTSVRGSNPTAVRAGAVLRSLAAHFVARPDLTALRIAAGKQGAPQARTALSQELARLRALEARLHRRLCTHRARKEHFASLLPPAPPEGSARAL